MSILRPVVGHFSNVHFSFKKLIMSQPVVGYFSGDPALDGSWSFATATISFSECLLFDLLFVYNIAMLVRIGDED